MIRFGVLLCSLVGIAFGAYFNAPLPENLLELDGRGPYLSDNPVNENQFAVFQEFDGHEPQPQEYERGSSMSESQYGGEPMQEDLRIPGEKPKGNESYLCTAFKSDERFVLSFEPLSDNHNAHHIIVFACSAPGIETPVMAWDCGEMSGGQSAPSQYIKAPPCSSSAAPIYAWSHGAGDGKTQLPEGVAFHLGDNMKNQFIVLQVHYMHEPKEEDYSGVRIKYTYEPQPKTAATLLLVTGGQVASKSRESFEAACVVDEPVTLHPIAFRVHTHRHGERVEGWVVKGGQTGRDEWFSLGQRDPQKPQIFEPVKNTSLLIEQGDVLTSRCTIYNNEDHSIEMGPSSEDEMCNFYLIYYTENKSLSDNVCYSPGAPSYHWSQNAGLNNIPN